MDRDGCTAPLAIFNVLLGDSMLVPVPVIDPYIAIGRDRGDMPTTKTQAFPPVPRLGPQPAYP